MSTYQAATGSYAALSAIPVVGPALGIAAAGAAVVAGLANVKKILAVKSGLPGDSGGSGGSISGGGGGGSAPRGAATAGNINQGIVSRDTLGIGSNEDIQLQPTLVVDDVTVNQDQQAANNETSTI